MVWILDNLDALARQFGDVAGNDPLSAVLLAVGALVLAFSSGLFGYLALRGLLAGLIPDSIGRAPPRDAR